MKRTFVHTTPDQVIIYPDKVYRIFGFAAVVLAVIFAAASILMLPSGGDGAYTFSFVLMTPLLLVAVIFIALSEKQVIFDRSAGAVFHRIFFLNKQLITFDAIDRIHPVNKNGQGMHYAIARRSNRYGKGIRISAGYFANSSERAAFETNILPRLEQMIQASFPLHAYVATAPAAAREREAQPGAYPSAFIHRQEGLAIKGANNPFMAPLTITGAGLVFIAWYYLRDGVIPFDGHWWYVLLPGIAAVFFYEQVIFDVQARVIRVRKLFGLFAKEYAFNSFVRFHIIRQRTNAIYSGTKVAIELSQGEGKPNKQLDLISVYKTKKIDRLVQETEDILRQKPGAAGSNTSFAAFAN